MDKNVNPKISIEDEDICRKLPARSRFSRVIRYFVEGLLILIPTVGTAYLIYLAFTKIDGWLNLPIPGVGFLITVFIILLVGFLGSNIITRRAFNYIEAIFTKPPVVKLVYGSLKDLIGAFVGDKKSFDQPVLVSLTPGGTARALGFITRDSLETVGLPDHVAVYLPQAYNFAGNVLIFAREQVTPLNIESSKIMAFLVSGGVSGEGL
ncbi:MAG: DUF502 domain-containing protein [Armatimonadetes bacterium]|nr:DUF502 domain-containing protein [Armatimonadota bacterium]